MTAVYTIGHSNLAIQRFISLLNEHGIARVIDLRSAPYSAWAPQFNKREIEASLADAGIEYVYAGDRLGGKPADESLYTPSGAPDYQRIGETQPFIEGLEWLIEIAGKSRTAIMCSEADPFSCHREGLIGEKLRERGLDVLHITSEGNIAIQQQGSLF